MDTRGVFADYLPQIVASWNPQCSAVNRSVIQQLGQQIVALEEDLCRLRKNLKNDVEVLVTLSTKEKEIEALRESTVHLEKVLLKANQRILDLEQQNEKLTIQQHSDRQVIKNLSSRLKIKPKDLAREVAGAEWDPNDAAVALEKLTLAKNYQALKRKFEENSRVHVIAIEKLGQSHKLSLKEKMTDIEELRQRNKELQSRLEERRSSNLDKKALQLEGIQRDFVKAVHSRVDRAKALKTGKDFHQHELVRIVDSLEKENKEKDKQLEESKKKIAEQIQYFKLKLKQLRVRKKREEEGLRNHVCLLEDQIRKLRAQIQSSKSNSNDTSDNEQS
ncbi:citron Rho-interacting kinase-like [Neocloeon triangulifer]|uniref:citron Rho-interacting kinase-like n=1 Tax=Neocloeon triangulifer TaxID=2078957 RepID=UPI00286FA8D0|nr:citron Rho-interacting kinase-like [Neocloeon triangulifer]